MKNIRDIILANQENQDFMTRVENSQTVENLYSVLCEYGYSSDMKEFEQDVYEILKNSDLVTNSVSDDELEKVSGGVNMRQKIMSIVALTGLTVGGVQNFVGAKSQNKLRSEQRKQHKITKGLPTHEKIGLGIGIPSTLGVVVLLPILGSKGITYIKKQKSSKKEFQETNTDYVGGMDIMANKIEFEYINDPDEHDHEMSYDQALEVVKQFFATPMCNLEEYTDAVYNAVLTIRKILFPDDSWKVANVQNGWGTTKLKSFPKSKQSCIDQSEQVFIPLSWQNGAGGFERDDDYMLYKCLFQYLCRMLALCPIMTEKMTEEQGYQYASNGPVTYQYEPVCRDTLLGCRNTGNSEIPDYHSLFVHMVQQMQGKKLVDTNEYKLCQTLQDIYNAETSRLQKFGVFCGKEPRKIDN